VPPAHDRARQEDGPGAAQGAAALLAPSMHHLSPILVVTVCCVLCVQEPFIQKNPHWVEELELMLRTGEKAEIQVTCMIPTSECPTN
jgi:hypothetical protein